MFYPTKLQIQKIARNSQKKIRQILYKSIVREQTVSNYDSYIYISDRRLAGVLLQKGFHKSLRRTKVTRLLTHLYRCVSVLLYVISYHISSLLYCMIFSELLQENNISDLQLLVYSFLLRESSLGSSLGSSSLGSSLVRKFSRDRSLVRESG